MESLITDFAHFFALLPFFFLGKETGHLAMLVLNNKVFQKSPHFIRS